MADEDNKHKKKSRKPSKKLLYFLIILIVVLAEGFILCYDYATNDFIKENEVKTGVNKYVVILIILLAIMCLVNIFDDKSKAKSRRN